MDMTPQDIVKDYRESKNKKMQIGILADQNLCAKDEIIKILKENGIPEEELEIPKKGRPKTAGGSQKSKKAAVPKKEEALKQQYGGNTLLILRKIAAKEMTALQEEIDRMEEDLKTLSEFMEETREETACS